MRIEGSLGSQIAIPNTHHIKGQDNTLKHKADEINKDTEAESPSSVATNAAQDENKINDVQEIQDIAPSAKIQDLDGNTNRITYGLKVIELMSDAEYQAFLWATQDLSESEKILMAQSLYRFTAFYQGKDSKQQENIDIHKLNAQRAFGVEHSMIDDFIQRYKNAYDKFMLSQV
ncbi:hypothetical protein [Helicobacter mastomyrinus]|uniref:Uncharacterized protein n=2 Tax=Helicobacter TaxID=209 RepID=A0ABZ3F4Y3_9HELI|nr:hypothetical protein [uncultured Helicobacter sp.]